MKPTFLCQFYLCEPMHFLFRHYYNYFFFISQLTLVYNDIKAKKARAEKMAQQGKRQYEYDSDEVRRRSN